MASKLLRFALLLEFLVAVIAVFTAWSEIGGQGALDLMPWGYKFVLGLALAAAIVGYTASILEPGSIWRPKPARWLSFILVIGLIMGVVTYYYVLQEEMTDSDETGNAAAPLTLVMPGYLAP